MRTLSIFTKIIAFLVICLISQNMGYAEDNTSKDIYKKGAVTFLKVRFPTAGFIGGPPSPASRPLRMPKNKDDYTTVYVRLTIDSVDKKDNKFRVVLKLDKIDSKGNVEQGALYYAYWEKSGDGWRIIQKEKNDGTSDESEINRSSIPFPLGATLPLSFVGEKERFTSPGKGSKSYHISPESKSQASDKKKYRKIDISVFDRTDNMQKEGLILEQVDSIRSMTKTLRMKYKETQEWDKGTWIWEKMKRFDKKGNFMLECNAYTNLAEMASEENTKGE